jgi:hypothetical protein
MSWDLRHGRYQDAFDPWFACDAVICDPPYGARTHEGHNAGEEQVRTLTGQVTRTAIGYQHWTPADVEEFVAWAVSRCRGWICAMTSDDLAPVYREEYERHGRYSFTPVPIIQKRPRLVGDGPASWTVWLMVARPRSREFATWGCLPGAYQSHCEKNGAVAGAKPLDLMRAIVRDYSRQGDIVCDPCAGGGTTLLAALFEGRLAVGSEREETTHANATKRLIETAVPVRPLIEESPREQLDLLGDA